MGKSKRWLRLMTVYVRFRMRRAFHDVLGRGVGAMAETLRQGPVILVTNHVAWWDPLLLMVLEERLGSDGFALMAAHSLRELPFFARLGALPLHQDNPRLAVSELDRAANLLDQSQRFVAVFASGKQRPSHFPLLFQRGFVRVQRKSGARIVPMAIRYEFLESAKPTLLFSLGSAVDLPLGLSPKQAVVQLEEHVAHELYRIDRELNVMLENPMEPARGFESLLFDNPRPLRAGRVPFLGRLLGARRPRIELSSDGEGQ